MIEPAPSVDVERERVRLGHDPLQAAQPGDGPLGGRGVGAVERERDDVVAHLRLELLRRALGDDRRRRR